MLKYFISKFLAMKSHATARGHEVPGRRLHIGRSHIILESIHFRYFGMRQHDGAHAAYKRDGFDLHGRFRFYRLYVKDYTS